MKRMNACFQNMATTVLPFGGWGLSLYVLVTDVLCGEPFIIRLCCMHEIPLRPVTTVALFRSQASPCGIYGGQNGIGTCLFRVRRFPPVIVIALMPHTHHSTLIPVTMYMNSAYDSIIK